jgi:hypothetical protein
VRAPRLDLLELLAAKLETETRIPFDYGYWVGNDWDGNPELLCGTTVCAGGLATTIPEFRDLGLRLEMHQGAAALILDNSDHYCEGSSALAHLLSLTYEEAAFIFLPMEYPPNDCELTGHSPNPDATARQMAAHIRRFVEWKRGQMVMRP